MNDGLSSLHKVLKDETRRKIILLLNDKGSLSYTDLMNALGNASTGKLNYHLKILNSLIAKGADGQYALTEKGILASRLVLEFADDNGQKLEMRTRWGWSDVASVVKRKMLVTSAGILTIVAACLSFVIGTVGFIAFFTLFTAPRFWGYNIYAFFLVTLFGFVGFSCGLKNGILMLRRHRLSFVMVFQFVLFLSLIITAIAMNQSVVYSYMGHKILSGGFKFPIGEWNYTLWMATYSWLLATIYLVIPAFLLAFVSTVFTAKARNVFG